MNKIRHTEDILTYTNFLTNEECKKIKPGM